MRSHLDTVLGLGASASGSLYLAASAIEGSTFAAWIERIGLPAFLLLAVAAGVVKVARYLGSNVIEPMTSRHLQFVAKVEQSAQASADATERTATLFADFAAETARDRRAVAESQQRGLELIVSRIDATGARLDRIEDAMGMDGPPPKDEED